LIPGLGAFAVRSSWRKFRFRLLRSSYYPFLDYADLGAAGPPRYYRLFGQLEAIRAKDQVWIRSGDFSVAADLHRVPVYILPGSGADGDEKEPGPDEQPQIIPWRQISSLPARTPVFIAGRLGFEDGQPEFRSEAKEPLLVVLYGGDRDTLLRRAIRGGRQRNEYWNQFTLVSLITGCIILFLVGYFSYSQSPSRLPTIVSITLSLSPLVPLLPPGVLFLLLYRFYWKRARILRSQRDLQRLPLRFFRSDIATSAPRKGWQSPDRSAARLPGGQSYVMIADKKPEQLREAMDDPRSELPVVPLSIPPSGAKTYMFGASVGGKVAQPRDPMVERVLVRGDPEVNAQRCSDKARSYEIYSALLFALAVVSNFLLVFLALRYLIR